MELKPVFSRRSLLAGSLFAGMGTILPPNTVAKPNSPQKLKSGMTILFQGDSITDAGRKNRQKPLPNDQQSMGNGYASMAASALLTSSPELELSIYNLGISGNKVHQLAARWQKECLDYKPDILSILIGVNDIWHGIQGKYDGTVKRYEDDYRKLLQRTRASLPRTQLVICEPFVLRCGAVTNKWFPEFDRYRESARKVAKEHGAFFVPFQSIFNEALKFAPPEYWARDGVHPTSHGAALMAEHWLQTVRS